MTVLPDGRIVQKERAATTGEVVAAGIAGARYARPRNPADSDRGLILASLRAVFWEHFERAA